MKVKELLELLGSAHPESEVEIYHCPGITGDATTDSEYELVEITGVGDWGNPGCASDLTTIKGGKITGG